MRKTKIVCTIGPSSSSEETLRALIEAGMDVARLNFSHGTQAEHERVIGRVRGLSEELGRPVGILQDLCGPKIRIRTLRESSVLLREGNRIVLTAKGVADTPHREGDERRIEVSYARLAEDVRPGETVLIDDGAIALEVVAVEQDGLVCEIKRGGPLLSEKGVNFPDSRLRVHALTPKDREDLLFGIEQGVDWVALSFVRSPEDLSIAGAIGFVRTLYERGLTLFLASGTDEAYVRNEVEHLGIARYFKGGLFGARRTFQEYSKEKVIRRILKEHHLQGEALMVVGDGPVEIRHAREVGAMAVGVASDEVRRRGWNERKRERLIRAGADLLIPDFEQADELLDLLNL